MRRASQRWCDKGRGGSSLFPFSDKDFVQMDCVQKYFVQKCFVQKYFVQKYFVRKYFVQKYFVQKHFVQSYFVQNYFVQKYFLLGEQLINDSYSFSLTTYETHSRRFNEMGLINVSLNCLCIVCCHTRYDPICVLYDKDTVEWKFDTNRPIFHFVMSSIDALINE